MVSVEFASITIAILLAYIFFYWEPTRWKRMVGCFGIMILSVGLGAVADTIPLFILMAINLMIAGLKFIEDVGKLMYGIK